MRIFFFILFTSVTLFLCWLLHTSVLLPAALGKLLSPQQGIWQNAENFSSNPSGELRLAGVKNPIEIIFDERLVPHVFAQTNEDAYFAQGFLHAKYRLWQMELQALAAGGRATEVIGEIALNHDREFRRLGMTYAAEQALTAIESDPESKAICDAYTAGVNAFIASLTESSLPLEYKLIGYYPEKWSNLKTALFLKYMSYDLAGREQDFERTNARSYFGAEDYNLLFPKQLQGMDPIIPGKLIEMPQLQLNQPVDYDTIPFETLYADEVDGPDAGNGSNNWAISGSRTGSGYPILANDPHLGLNLPSLWFEMQLNTPDMNVYGVSFPGAPSIPIGFNNNIAWGVTNGGRDVRDYYEIRFKDENRLEYLYNDEWLTAEKRIEKFFIKGKETPFYDTVYYTIHGPVMYDDAFGGMSKKGRYFAVKWTAHEQSNELMTFVQLNKAKNYDDFLAATERMKTPGQNFVFASATGDIALRTQGHWPAKWSRQGDFVMPGWDSTYVWQGFIPSDETPSQFNPERGFVSSANQAPADSAYPYYLGTDYPIARGNILNRLLQEDSAFTPEKTMALQTNNYNIFAEAAVPEMLFNLPHTGWVNGAEKYHSILHSWNFFNDATSQGATVFEIWWDEFYSAVFKDDYEGSPKRIAWPSASTLLWYLQNDSAFKFYDDRSTAETETLQDILLRSFNEAVPKMQMAENAGKLGWARYKDTRILHLSKLLPFSRMNLPIGGGRYMLNATRDVHGPSWRMVVQMGPQPEAWGVYPGGQSGNPASKYYDNFIDHWAEGKYFRLWLMKNPQDDGEKTIGKISIQPAG